MKLLQRTPTVREIQPPRLAIRCRRFSPAALRALTQLREPVDLWLHRHDRHRQGRLERLPNVRRVFFSPVKGGVEFRDLGQPSHLPVYGRYDDVLELEDMAADRISV